jgi:hypothetical protein
MLDRKRSHYVVCVILLFLKVSISSSNTIINCKEIVEDVTIRY